MRDGEEKEKGACSSKIVLQAHHTLGGRREWKSEAAAGDGVSHMGCLNGTKGVCYMLPLDGPHSTRGMRKARRGRSCIRSESDHRLGTPNCRVSRPVSDAVV